jgi:hypothetical protein
MNNDRSDIIVEALECLPTLLPEGLAPGVIRDLVIEVIFLREELTQLLTRARCHRLPELPDLPMPEVPPETSPEIVAGIRERHSCKPKALPPAPTTNRGKKSGKPGAPFRKFRGKKTVKLLKAICSSPGKTPREYAVSVYGSVAAGLRSVQSFCTSFKKYGFIYTEGHNIYPTDACKVAVGL